MLAERPQTCNIDSTEQLRLTLCLCQTDTILGIVWAESEQTDRIDCVTKMASDTNGDQSGPRETHLGGVQIL